MLFTRMLSPYRIVFSDIGIGFELLRKDLPFTRFRVNERPKRIFITFRAFDVLRRQQIFFRKRH